jgi:hypothetical protein
MEKDGCGPLSRAFPLRKRRKEGLVLLPRFILAKCNKSIRIRCRDIRTALE